MKRIVFMALLGVMLVLPLLPAVVRAEGGDGPITAALLVSSGDQGQIQPSGERWYRYDVSSEVEQVEFTLHFWPNDEVRYQEVRLELFTAQQASQSIATGEMAPLGQGFALNRQEQALPVGRRVWMGWLVPGAYYLRVVNDSASNTFNYLVNSGLEGTIPAPAAPAKPQKVKAPVPPAVAANPKLANAPAPVPASAPAPALAALTVQTTSPILQSGVLGLRGLRPSSPEAIPPNSVDAILENKANLYPADAPLMYEIQHGRVRYGQVRWYKFEIGDKQERIDFTMHFWPSNGNIYHHVFFGIFTDYRLQVWQHDGPFQAVGLGGDTGRLEDRALILNKKVWRGDLPHGVHYVGVWTDTDLANPELGDDKVDFIDFLLVPTFYNQPNLPLPVTNIPDWLARPLTSRPLQSGVLAGPRLVNPGPVAPGAPAPTNPPATKSGSGELTDVDQGALASMTNRWYRYDVKDKDGERLTVTIEWNYSDGNTYHQAGFGVFDRFQFDAYLRDNKTLGLGIAGTTGVDADFGPPMSRKVWKGVLPEGTYFIRVYNESNSRMDYTLHVAR